MDYTVVAQLSESAGGMEVLGCVAIEDLRDWLEERGLRVVGGDFWVARR